VVAPVSALPRGEVERVKLAVADVETTRLAHGERPQTLFWGLAVDGEEYRRFDTTAQLWNYLVRRRDPLCVYSHHDYDMVQSLVDGAPLKIVDVRSGRVLRAKIGVEHEWRNSHALFPSSLKEILEACGYAKPGLESLELRNRADTVDALEAFKKCAEQYELIWGVQPLGSKYLTAASCAFAAAEKVAGKLPRYLMDREYYRGGRVEAFRVGPCGQADAWDINSSYPYSFMDAPASDVLVVCDVDVRGDGPGPLCWINRDAEKLLFPAGRFRTAVWASNYERYIRPHGAVRALSIVKKIPCDLSWVRELRGMIAHAYTQRLEAKKRGDGAFAYAAKIGMNSIYGRLGLKARREIAVIADTIPEGDDVTYYRIKSGYLSFKEIFSNPAANYLFASFITDNARARLYDGLMRAQGEAFYCDTDSVYLRAGTKFPMRQGNDCGAWKFEGTDSLTVNSVKDYYFGGKTVLKGGDEQYQWTLRRCVGEKNVALIQKNRRTSYDKRDVQWDGSTVPRFLSEW
jgi:hypothetical protein